MSLPPVNDARQYGSSDNSIMPDVLIEGSDESMGAIITILNKLPGYRDA